MLKKNNKVNRLKSLIRFILIIPFSLFLILFNTINARIIPNDKNL